MGGRKEKRNGDSHIDKDTKKKQPIAKYQLHQ